MIYNVVLVLGIQENDSDTCVCGEKEIYTHLNAEFQKIAERDKKNQCEEIEENNRMRKTRDLFKKIRDKRRQWQPTPVLLPGKSHGRRGLVGCSTWGR